MRTVVVGGSASNVGKTTLACHLLAASSAGRKVGLKVSVCEAAGVFRLVLRHRDERGVDRGDSARLLEAGATEVVWVTTSRQSVRAGLARGLLFVRKLRPDLVVIESTAAGIHLRRVSESWFVQGEGPSKPWAALHLCRATHVLRSRDVLNGEIRDALIA
jgi:molybdopterin-guanine dinucleotide biosynthesis protein